jgi:outer membrane receptor protein involved in Fe transport
MKPRVFAVFIAAVLSIFMLNSAIWSQTVQGVITGIITDPSGAFVPGATVAITNQGTGAFQSTTTRSDGSYHFPLVPPGTYTIDVKAANFAELRARGIVVEANQTVPFSVTLEIAKGTAVVEVIGVSPLVQAATSDLSLQVDRAVIENAALPDRDVLSVLPFMATQATRGLDGNPTVGGARESGTSYLLNGADNNDNASEGSINIHPPLESIQDLSILTNNMSAEFGRGIGAVVSANQKSGTNQFHGAVYEYNRNDALNANDFFSNRQGLPRPKYVRNQFGGEIDGPIRKDKTFFSFAYDRAKLIAGSTAAQTFVPTSGAIAYIKANGGPLAQQVLAARPPVTSDASCPSVDPTGSFTGAGTGYWGNGLPNPVGCLSFSDPQEDTEDSYYGRVDHNFGAKDRLSFSANFYVQDAVGKYGGGPLTTIGPINSTTVNHWHNLALSETHTFSPHLLNEAILAHNRHYNVFTEGKGTPDTLPSIGIDDQTGGFLGMQIGGDNPGVVLAALTQDRWGITDNLTWTVGRHTLKFGGGNQSGILYRNWDLGPPGFYEFGELAAINTGGASATCPAGALITPGCDGTLQPDGTIANVSSETNANFAGDYPYFQETSVDPATGAKPNAYRHYTYHDWYWFVQDDWKVTPKLTLNLGLRWDRYGAPSEVHNILAQFTNLTCNILDPSCIAAARVNPVSRMWNTNNKDFAPRVGFAWDPTGDGKTAIRGGYGIFYDRIFDYMWSNGAWNPPFYGLLDFANDAGDAVYYSNPASIGPAYDPSIPGCQVPNVANVNCIGHRVSVRTMDVNMHDSSGQNYFLGVERQTFGGILIRAQYQGSMGRHLPMLKTLNRYDGDAYGVASADSLSAVRPNPLYTEFNYRSNSVSSNYNALVVEAQKRMGHGLEFQTGYTFSKLLDVNSELFAGCTTIGVQSAPYDYISNDRPRLSYGRAAYDARHSFKFNFVYELPFWKAQNGFVGHVLGGWIISSFFQFYSGHPIDVYNGRAPIRARDANGNLILDQNGKPFNVGGDYNLDGTTNDKPVFTRGQVYSGASPADGIFTNNNRIGCGGLGIPSSFSPGASSSECVGFTPSSLFINPPYPGGPTPYERFGTLGRDVFQGAGFLQMDMNMSKVFQITERVNLKFSAQAQNLTNHPSFDCIDSNVASSTFGRAQCLAQSGATGQSTTSVFVGGIGLPVSRIMSIGLRLSF